MSYSDSDLKLWLLDLIFQQDVNKINTERNLTEADWDAIQAMAISHRLCPLIHWRLTHECSDITVPDKFRTTCANSFKASALRSLQIQAELVTLHRLFAENKINYVFLKGAWLAFHAYPHSALRPLRDVDVLVPSSDVIRAYEALMAAGFQKQSTQYGGSLDACILHNKHLPPLLPPSNSLGVELHHRLYNPDSVENNQYELSEGDGFWGHVTRQEFMGLSMSYLSPEQQLIHLVEHAVYDHQFTNGPLVISDIRYTIDHYSVDWDVFWEFARQGVHQRGATLLFRLVERYSPNLKIKWPHEKMELALDDQLLNQSALLMLRDLESKHGSLVFHKLKEQRGLHSKAKFIANNVLFPSKSRMASLCPVEEDSKLIYFWYAVKWFRMLIKHGLPVMRAFFQGKVQSESDCLRLVNNWLRGYVSGR